MDALLLQYEYFNVFIQMTSYVSESNYPGYEQYVKRNNLKEATKTFNYLSEHNLLNYKDFQNHISDPSASIMASDQHISDLESSIHTQQLIQKQCDYYHTCRDIILKEKAAPDKAAYRRKHAQQYKLHDSILQNLSDLGIHKLPSQDKMQRQMYQLQEEYLLQRRKNRLCKTIRKLLIL